MPMPDLALGHVYAFVPTRAQGWSCRLPPTTEIQASAHSQSSLDPYPKTSRLGQGQIRLSPYHGGPDQSQYRVPSPV